MPRYHFNVFDGITDIDRIGREHAGLVEARVAAVHYAGTFIADQSKRVALGEDWCMEVTDDKGKVLFRLSFMVAEELASNKALLPDRPA